MESKTTVVAGRKAKEAEKNWEGKTQKIEV